MEDELMVEEPIDPPEDEKPKGLSESEKLFLGNIIGNPFSQAEIPGLEENDVSLENIGEMFVDYEDFLRVCNKYIQLLDHAMAYVNLHEEGPLGHDCPQCNFFRGVRRLYGEEYGDETDTGNHGT